MRIGIIDNNNFDKFASVIRSVYRLRNREKSKTGDFSVEFADELFSGRPSELPFVMDLSGKTPDHIKPGILIINNAGRGVWPELLREVRAILVNTDEVDASRIFADRRKSVISYGFNSRASVTASSVRDNNLMVCVQRTIPTLSGGQIEQQEFSVNIGPSYRGDISHMLAAVTAALIDD